MSIKIDTLDMMAELFIDKQQEGHKEFWIPPNTEEDYLKKAANATIPEEREQALGSVVLIYRSKNISSDGKYDPDTRHNLISIIEKNAKESAANMLIQEGSYCEKGRDFESAVDFYSACVRSPKTDIRIIYFSQNNLGFCLNFLRRFDEAERFLREAVFVCPEKYNAWKNLGVSLEWQGQYEEAVECYLKAVTISKGEPRSHLHLKRLLDRHPTLKKLPCFA